MGIVSRSGTLTYQALYELKQKGIGVSTCVGIGGDPVPGTSFVDCLAEFEKDPETHAIMLIGEIGGSAEEEAAEFITAAVTKPMSAYIAGVTAPAGKKMGHAGAIVSGGKGTAQGKMDALRAAGVQVGLNPTEAGELMAGDRRRGLTPSDAPVRALLCHRRRGGGGGGGGGGGMAVVVFGGAVGAGDGQLVRALAEQGHDRARAHGQRAEEHDDAAELQRRRRPCP